MRIVVRILALSAFHRKREARSEISGISPRNSASDRDALHT
jgi:hypothetical protein